MNVQLKCLAGACALATAALAAPAHAQDAFEIQVYNAETAAAWRPGIEIHTNWFATGSTTRSADGELPTDGVMHLTFEPHLGILSWFEVGAYFQTALRPEGSLDFGGMKFRAKARYPRRLLGGLLGLALNVEFGFIPSTYEAHVRGSEIRPVVDLTWRRLYLSVNPILSVDLAGDAAGHPQFEPAATATVRVVGNLSLGVEYYGAFGPLDALLPAAEQSHRIFGVLNLDHATRSLGFEFNLGVGYGLSGPERWIAKMIFAIDLT